MQKIFYTFWEDERGAALISDWIFLTSILVVAILPCMLNVRERLRQSLITENRHAEFKLDSRRTTTAARGNVAKCD
jgi:hypothetical protein